MGHGTRRIKRTPGVGRLAPWVPRATLAQRLVPTISIQQHTEIGRPQRREYLGGVHVESV